MSSTLQPKSDNKADYLYQLRHSAAHVLAQAVKELYPNTKLTIGPPTEDGFYYDFDCEHRFTEQDLKQIENRMRRNLKNVEKFVGEEKTREYLQKAGFRSVETKNLAHDIQNNWYVVRK